MCILRRTAPKNVVRIQAKYRKSGTQHPCRQDEKSQQPKVEHQKRNTIDDIKDEIKQEKKRTKYLGLMITFQQQETTEIRNRIRAAGATFLKCRQELTSRTYGLRHRLRLFEAVVSLTMNYASGTWTLTKEHERMINRHNAKCFGSSLDGIGKFASPIPTQERWKSERSD